jgi:hypothetical protein
MASSVVELHKIDFWLQYALTKAQQKSRPPQKKPEIVVTLDEQVTMAAATTHPAL